ncbi:mannose-6-phosphate isomerase-like protein (cupin superfamily) [Friedmanniella antarctica]|uniref:Mannose-6-phosphate isomerase-like protein (Cupin superfamily) n=1 Tax=Microlunatus antarcticus TaxID=53388 RepID=A0A7W5P7P1_9ACTN|nr:hypothetical protein [Microlunatus antarcticus]MBB3327081.1 mannose-6-phosphate isomerase-like protein (cupin superfamily) [Microlunatus antarcticus]
MTPVRTPVVDETRRRPPDSVAVGGSRTWSLRGKNFAVAVTELVAGIPLVEPHAVDEHILIVADDAGAVVTDSAGRSERLTEPSLVVVPAGRSTIEAARDTVVLRVFAAHDAELMRLAVNDGPHDDPAVAPLLTDAIRSGGRLRVHRMSQIPDQPGRLGRIFCTSSLMINWFPTKIGARDPEALSPHAHDDFEQMSVTLQGAFVHHFRTPWTTRMSEWRDDDHVSVDSPSMVLIPPNLIHTTSWTGEGAHVLVDVFAPPREDFLAEGWVINADEYAGTSA